MINVKKSAKKAMLFLITLVIVASSVFFSACGNIMSEEFVMRSRSEKGTYVLEAYRESGGIKEEPVIKVYRTENDSKKLVFTDKISDVEIKWQSDSAVLINGKELDLSKDETYDWSKQ